jgi:hypothetical protein
MKFIFYTGGVASPDGIGDPKIIPSSRGTGDGKNTGFGPETAGTIVPKRQVKELAGLETGQEPLGCEIHGIDMIAVIGDFLNSATEFLRGGHYCAWALSGKVLGDVVYFIHFCLAELVYKYR